VGINYDITDRKEAEEVLARSNEELERLVQHVINSPADGDSR